MTKQEKQYLEQMPGGRWRVTVSIPKTLQSELGRTRLKEALNTDSLAQARQLRWPVVARLKARIEETRMRTQSDDLCQNALAYLHEYRREKSTGGVSSEYSVTDMIAERAERIAGQPIGITPNGEPEYDPVSEEKAKAFYEIATGRTTPVDALFQRFQQEKNWDAKTFGRLRRTTKLLKGWCQQNGHNFSIEYLGKNKRVISEFLFAAKAENNWQVKTLNGYVSALSSYWKWLIDRGYTDSNPWER